MLIGSITHQFVPVETRVPLKFGTETLTSVTCSRIRLEARGSSGAKVTGWGETPLSVQWVWPSALSYVERHEALMAFSESLVEAWTDWKGEGDALEAWSRSGFEDLPKRLDAYNAIERKGCEPMPWLAALVCASPIDLALHDAFGQSLGRPTYACYSRETLAHDLSHYLEPAEDSKSASRADIRRIIYFPIFPKAFPCGILSVDWIPSIPQNSGETNRTTVSGSLAGVDPTGRVVLPEDQTPGKRLRMGLPALA